MTSGITLRAATDLGLQEAVVSSDIWKPLNKSRSWCYTAGSGSAIYWCCLATIFSSKIVFPWDVSWGTRYCHVIAKCLPGCAARANNRNTESITLPFIPSCKGVWKRTPQLSTSCKTEMLVGRKLEWMMDTNLLCLLRNLVNRSNDKKHTWVLFMVMEGRLAEKQKTKTRTRELYKI